MLQKKAFAFFEVQTKSYKKAAIWHVISAKQEITRLKRLEMLINDSENELHIKHLRRTKPKRNKNFSFIK